ncbi:MAG: site-specific integrase [Alphaproteobacteria bacterium]|nr:site-specific integrase [Alphaproteobacteria bacterium]
MATIETRRNADGTTGYRAKVRLKGFPSESATFERKTDAKEWAKQTEASMRQGRHFKTSEAKKHTVGELIDRYLREIEKKNPQRFVTVKLLLGWWKREIGVYLLSDVSRALITEQRDKLLNTRGHNVERRSNSTVNRYMTALGNAFTVATNEWEWMKENPMRKISKLSEPRGRVRFLDDDERERLLEACKASANPYLHTLVVLALSTGARQGELLNLRWSDVDWQRRVITLHDTKNKERRLLPLAHYALHLMEEHNKVRNIASDLVFPSPSRPMKPWDSRTSWVSVLKKANIQDFRFHDLRHSCASYLAMNGASIAEIAEVLGHKTLQMVKRYAHLSEAHTAKVVQRMNERIFG